MSRAERVIGKASGAPGDGNERLQRLAGRIRPPVLAGERVLPVASALEGLLPEGGLRRGSTVVVGASPAGPGHDRGSRPQGALSLALGLVGAATAGGAWSAVVGVDDLGLVAAAELGVALERLALVPRVAPPQWVVVVGALLDALDVVVVRPPGHLGRGDARRLTARAREREAVLIPILTEAEHSGPWADGADVRLVVMSGRWEGPGTGEGHLTRRRLEVTAGGRGAASRGRHLALWLPGAGGGIELVAEQAPLPAPGLRGPAHAPGPSEPGIDPLRSVG